MAVQLHHLVTDLKRPGKTALQVLEGNIADLKRKAFAQCALEKICYVALVAICAVVFAVSYKVVVVTGVTAAALAGLILVSPVLLIAPAKLAQWSRLNKARAEFNEQVYLQLKKMDKWGRQDVEKFFDEFGLDKSLLNDSCRDLLPVIAQMQCLLERAESSQKNLAEMENAQEKEWKGKNISEEEKLNIRYNIQVMKHDRVEGQIVPDLIRALLLSRIIENPKETVLDVDPFDLTMKGLGECVPKSYALRVFGSSLKESSKRNDDYFHFHPKLKREPLKFWEIWDTIASEDLPRLRPMLLPGAPRIR